jgi:hypothetical protein
MIGCVETSKPQKSNQGKAQYCGKEGIPSQALAQDYWSPTRNSGHYQTTRCWHL